MALLGEAASRRSSLEEVPRQRGMGLSCSVHDFLTEKMSLSPTSAHLLQDELKRWVPGHRCNSTTQPPSSRCSASLHSMAAMKSNPSQHARSFQACKRLAYLRHAHVHFGCHACRLWSLSGPVILQSLFGYGLSVISAAFVGHMDSPVALSSVVLANSFYNGE